MKNVLICLLTVCISDAAAQIVSRDSMHLKPVGSAVNGSFVLVNKVIPLPEGEFTLVTTNLRDSKFVSGDYARQEHKLVDVVLAQMGDGKLRIAVGASTVLAASSGRVEWVSEPCKRTDTLYRLNRTPFMKMNYEQDCLLINHVINTLGSGATGVYAALASWIKDRGGATPIPTVIDTTITRISVGDYLAVRYWFNPEAYGCDAVPATSWTTSDWHKSRIGSETERARFVNGVIDVSKSMQIRVNEAFEGRAPIAQQLAATTPGLRNCR